MFEFCTASELSFYRRDSRCIKNILNFNNSNDNTHHHHNNDDDDDDKINNRIIKASS